jgi:hypothetical protein
MRINIIACPSCEAHRAETIDSYYWCVCMRPSGASKLDRWTCNDCGMPVAIPYSYPKGEH